MAPYRLIYRHFGTDYQLAIADTEDTLQNLHKDFKQLIEKIDEKENDILSVLKDNWQKYDQQQKREQQKQDEDKRRQNHDIKLVALRNIINRGQANHLDLFLNANREINLHTVDKEGITLLQMAATSGQTGIMKYLIDNGADCDLPDRNGWTALHLATLSSFDATKLLTLSGANVKATTNDGNTPLHHLARNPLTTSDNPHPLVENLILMFERGADINFQNDNGETPLHHACLYKMRENVRCLIKFSKADLEIPNKNGETCLHYAVRTCDKQLVHFLLRSGAKPDTLGKFGTCLDLAKTECPTLLPLFSPLLKKVRCSIQLPPTIPSRGSSSKPLPYDEHNSSMVWYQDDIQPRDQLGFVINEDHQHLYNSAKKIYEKTAEKVSKDWEKLPPASVRLDNEILKENRVSGHESSFLRDLVRRGVPSGRRAELWYRISSLRTKTYHLSNFEPSQQQPAPNYKSKSVTSSSMLSDDTVDAIEKDLNRTFPEHDYFQNEASREELRRILLAYSRKNVGLGYCQSMNFLAGFLILVVPDLDKCFQILCYIVDDLLENYFTKGMLGVLIDQKILEDLLTKFEPNVLRALERLNLPCSLVTSKWRMCLFLNCLPTEAVLRIWDCFLFEGPTILMSISLAVFRINREIICNATDLQTVWNSLQNFMGSTYNVEILFNVAFRDFGHISIQKLREQTMKTIQIEESGYREPQPNRRGVKSVSYVS